MIDIYNPFSLVNALNTQELANFWAASGATSRLPKFITNAELHLGDFENCRILRNVLETSDVTGVEFPYSSISRGISQSRTATNSDISWDSLTRK